MLHQRQVIGVVTDLGGSVLDDRLDQLRLDHPMVRLGRQRNDAFELRIAQHRRHEQRRVDRVGELWKVGALLQKIGPHGDHEKQVGMRFGPEGNDQFQQ